MWFRIIFLFLISFTHACAHDAPSIASIKDKPEFISLSSSTLPNNLKLSINHNRDWMISEPGSQADYSFLIYSFSENGKLVAGAKSYLDEGGEISFEVGKGYSFSDESVQNSLMTLFALGFHKITRLGDDGYRLLNDQEVSFDWPDVENWAYELNKIGAQ